MLNLASIVVLSVYGFESKFTKVIEPIILSSDKSSSTDYDGYCSFGAKLKHQHSTTSMQCLHCNTHINQQIAVEFHYDQLVSVSIDVFASLLGLQPKHQVV